jgi:exodeoxyribonuclease V alpha subunit
MKIAEERDLDLEEVKKGQSCASISDEYIPPCVYSINAFGSDEITAIAEPPHFFKDATLPYKWRLPPSTVCVWPYEEMYHSEGVRSEDDTRYDYDVRLRKAQEYFARVENDKSLIFYYANYSNPFSEEDEKRYVLIGISRVKIVGDILRYPNASEKTKKKFGGAFIWQCNITSHYPDDGLRIPYHLYKDQPEILDKILLVPDNPRNFKYATRQFADDEALSLVEQFLGVAALLHQIGDTSENWPARISWLQSRIAEIAQNRGLYPGLLKILDYLKFGDAIPFCKDKIDQGHEQKVKEAVFRFLDGKSNNIPGLLLTTEKQSRVRRTWQVQGAEGQLLLRDVLPRFAIPADQIARIVSRKRNEYSVEASLKEIADNPYLLCEQYVGDDADDAISFNQIDHGVLPSPELGGEPLGDTDDWRRLRALCVENLQREGKHTFVAAPQVLQSINRKLGYLPDWKTYQYSEDHLRVDEDELLEALTIRQADDLTYLYLKTAYEDERYIENQIRFLTNGPDIRFKTPMTTTHWENFLYNANSKLAEKNPKNYKQAIKQQAKVCEKVFVRPVCVILGEAGTGKTTVIKAIIQAIEKTQGVGSSFQLLAPTGKAADRIREATGKPATTIHSFLADPARNWINENRTFKRLGGRQESGFITYVIDEASMVDLGLLAALFRAIRWNAVQRLIFVGDPNQLPPIGRGRVFADIIDWLAKQNPESVGTLETNFRQMENALIGVKTGIIDLAKLYVRTVQTIKKDQASSIQAEEMLRRLQEGGDISDDLRVVYWNDGKDLATKLVNTVVSDMEKDADQKLDPGRPYNLWSAAFKGVKENERPEYQQVISPYRGEEFGTDILNTILQQHRSGRKEIEHRLQLGGIALFDKVIQTRNRRKSKAPWAYNVVTRRNYQLDEILNGELGFVKLHGLDNGKLGWEGFTLTRFQVQFSRRPNLWVNYEGKSEVETNLELAYALSVHKAQGSEFERVYFIVPKHKKALLSRELFYTGLTRAKRHCTLLIQEDISPLITLRRPENSHLLSINSSLFLFRPAPPQLLFRKDWYAEGKIHHTLTDYMVRSKSEVIIANLLHDRGIEFDYEVPLFAPDGSFYLPDFTINWRGEKYYWEHFGRMDTPRYKSETAQKLKWYRKFFPGRLVSTEETLKGKGASLTKDADKIIKKHFS